MINASDAKILTAKYVDEKKEWAIKEINDKYLPSIDKNIIGASEAGQNQIIFPLTNLSKNDFDYIAVELRTVLTKHGYTVEQERNDKESSLEQYSYSVTQRIIIKW